MKKHFKSIFVLMLILGFSIITIVGCGKKETGKKEEPTTDVVDGETDETKPSSTDPLEMITEGYYTYSFFAEGHGDYTFYFKFYEEAPVLGAVFYAGFANNGMNFAGTYTIEEKDYEYEAHADRDEIIEEVPAHTGTAPYTITFFDWDGNEIDSCGFDGKILYNDMENIAGAGSGPNNYYHDTEGETSKHASTYEEEAGVPYLDFVADEDSTSTLTLFHNMTYLDLMNMMVEGSWSMEENAEGGYDYTLTPADETDTGALVSVAADKKTAVYTPEGGEEIAMTVVSTAEEKPAYLFEGVQEVEEYATEAALALKLFADGTAELEVDIFDNVGVMDTGTYEVDGHTIQLNFEKAGEIQSELNADTQEVTIKYVATGTDIGDIDAVLTMAAGDDEGSGEASGEVLLSFEGGYTSFDCFTDNTFQFAYEDYGVEETGTWEFDAESYTFSITKSDGETITATIGEDHSMSFEYTAVASDQLKDTFTSPSDVWGPALMQ